MNLMIVHLVLLSVCRLKKAHNNTPGFKKQTLLLNP